MTVGEIDKRRERGRGLCGCVKCVWGRGGRGWRGGSGSKEGNSFIGSYIEQERGVARSSRSRGREWGYGYGYGRGTFSE